MYLKESCFLDCGKVSSVVLVLVNVEERSVDKNYPLLVSFLLLFMKFIKTLKIICLLIALRDVTCLLISNVVSGLFDQLNVFLQLHLIELCLGLLELWCLKYFRVLTLHGMLFGVACCSSSQT